MTNSAYPFSTQRRIENAMHPVDEDLLEHLSAFSLYARYLVRNPDEAESYVQEACKRILERRNQLIGENIKAYGIRIIQRLVYDAGRTRPVSELDDELHTADPDNDPDEVFMADELLSRIVQMGKLCAEVLLLVAMRFKQREIAEQLNLPANTVATRVSRCKQRLDVEGL